MIRTLFFIIALICTYAVAEEQDVEAAKEHIIDKRENYFQTSTPYKISPNVNPVTGDLVEEEVDLVIAGCEPISVRRFYSHTATYEPRTGGWRYNPETFLAANFEWPHQEIFAAIGEADGRISAFQPSAKPYIYAFNFSKGFVHFNPSGQSHPLNTHFQYCKMGDQEDKYRFAWVGEIRDGSGAKRYFASNMHSWLNDVRFTTGKKTFLAPGSKMTWVVRPNVWTPYQLPIHEEKRPNGNILCYSYIRWKDDKLYPRPTLLSTITAYNADKTKNLGSISFYYSKNKHDDVIGITAIGSDGRQVVLPHGSSPLLLQAAYAPDKPSTIYGYQGTWITRIEKPEGRIITSEYDAQGRVSVQSAPVGPNGEMHPIGRYIYQDRATEVYDAEGNKTIYRFNEHKQILSLETYQDGKVYRVDRLTWDTSNGNLLKKTVEDGLGHVLQITEYSYDKNHNPILEKIGDGNQWRQVSRTFSDDGFNLKVSETDREGKLICYRYIPNTNLLASELVYEGPNIKKRTFHVYDDCAICIKTIVDDGYSEDCNDLQGVTYRKITSITPRQQIPCFGLPEILEEKTIDASGNEILLNKVVYTYTKFGKVLKEEHFDAEGVYRYSILNSYDDSERLIAQTNSLGHPTTFTYDINHNLISISGPKPDQHQEIIYDKANRPIQIADWQSDGSIQTIEKKYDKLGRLIEEIDTCKNSTQFEYDALGRITAILYPDGAIDRKNYDLFGNVIAEIDPECYEIRKTYNAFGQVLTIDYPDGGKELFTYNSTGTIATHSDKNGATTVYTYDLFDHPIITEIYSSSNQLLKKISTVWTPFEKLAETNGDLTTIYTYDFAGRKTDEQQAYRQIHYVYDALGRPSITQEDDIKQIEEHDLLGQLIEKRTEINDNIQYKESYTYDENGNCTQIINSQGATTTSFNTQNKPLSIQDPLEWTSHFIYSYDNQHTQTTIDPKQIQAISIYDSREHEVQHLRKNAKGHVIQKYENTYNKNGNRIATTHTIFSETNPIGTVTHLWEYGPMGRIERFLEAGERETRYLYDDKGRLQTLIKPNGCSLLHEYDGLGRLSRFSSKDFDYNYAYDQNDHVTSVHDKVSNTTTTRSYDPLGNIVEERLANGLVFTNMFDTMGRRIGLTLPDSTCIDYIYDGYYLYQVKRGSYIHTYCERNLEGQIIKITLPDSQEMSIERDRLGRYVSYRSPHYTATYPKNAYDCNGNLLCYHCQDPFGKAEYTFSYDDLDQLIAESDHVYQFDSLYNRLKKDDSDYTINAFCQVNCDGNTIYEYDPCGNLIADGVCRYDYDSLDRLIAVEDSNQRIEYTYDPFNRRLSKTIFSNGKKVKHIRYLWDEDNEIGTIDDNNRMQELRILGEGLGAEIGGAILYEIKGKPYIPIHDHRGCVVVLVDLATKKPIESYRYSAFGEEQTGNTFSPWRFASKRVDEETGLIFFGRRYYHPSLGRFITQDPQGFEDGPNLYAYLKNCPMADFDLYGLFSWGGMWNGTKDFLYGGGSYLWNSYIREGISGLGYGTGKMGEWMYADFQYEYFNDRSLFQDKSYRATKGWKDLGQAAWDSPLDMIVPGFMEAWRNPTNPGAWGKAAVDIGLISFSVAKIRNAARLGRAGRFGEEIATFGKTGNAINQGVEAVSTFDKGISANRLTHIFGKSEHALSSLVSKFGSEANAFNAVQNAANQALKVGKLTPNAKGILPSGNLGNVINVEGMNVRLIGGRIENGQVIISSFSRKGL